MWTVALARLQVCLPTKSNQPPRCTKPRKPRPAGLFLFQQGKKGWQCAIARKNL